MNAEEHWYNSYRTVRKHVRALVGKRVWLEGDSEARYIHSVSFATTDAKYEGQPSGIVVHAHSNNVTERPNPMTGDKP